MSKTSKDSKEISTSNVFLPEKIPHRWEAAFVGVLGSMFGLSLVLPLDGFTEGQKTIIICVWVFLLFFAPTMMYYDRKKQEEVRSD